MRHIVIYTVTAYALLCNYVTSSNNTPNYFDTTFLVQYQKVKDALISDGFSEATFISSDGYTLKGLARTHPDAQYNIVISAGFYPGRKEGMATFAQLLPSDANILFLDNRGHGESSGSFIYSLAWYGRYEYKDIIGALDYLNNHKPLPSFLLGICIGAFHSAHAALWIEQHNKVKEYPICGIIFDSGFGSLTDLAWVPATHINDKALGHFFTNWLYTDDTKDMVSQRLAYRMTRNVSSFILSGLTYMTYPFIAYSDKQINLFDKIQHISAPMLYIHSKDDTYARFKDVERLSSLSKKPSCWWIDQSKHGCHHLKYAQEYQQRLLEFIEHSRHT